MCVSCSVVSDFLRPHELEPTRFLCPRNSPGKNTGVDCHSLLQRIFLTQGSNPGLLHHRQILYHLSYREGPASLLLLGPYISVLSGAHPCVKCPWIAPIFLRGSLAFPILWFSSISLHCSLKKAFLSLCYSLETLHSLGCIFPFLPCFLLLFPQL